MLNRDYLNINGASQMPLKSPVDLSFVSMVIIPALAALAIVTAFHGAVGLIGGLIGAAVCIAMWSKI
jgi:hypothetical protein